VKQEFIAKLRRLHKLLLVSGFCNILLAGFFLFSYFPSPSFQELEQLLICTFSPSAVSLSSLVPRLDNASLQELALHLADRTLVERGYRVRDIALSFLVSEHGIDLQRALNQPLPPQKRYLGIEKGGQKKFVELFQLSDLQFAAIQHFCKEERWPVTSEKMFANLISSQPHPPSLEYAFFLTKEFISIEKLLQKKYSSLTKESILSLLSEGPYSLIEKWSQLALLEIPSEDLFREFLFDYIGLGSKKAALLYLQTEMEYALKHLEEKKVLLLLSIKEKDPLKAKFAVALMSKSSNKTVLKQAKEYLLYHFDGEDLALLEKEEWYKRLVPQKQTNTQVKITQKTPPLQTTSKSTYTVQKGDTLWGISQKFSTSIGRIKKHNKLLSDLLTPGMKLIIPI